MSLDIRAVIVTIAYAIGINLILLSIANLGIGLECGSAEEFAYNETWNYTDLDDPSSVEFRANVWNIVFNRCEGLPTILWLLFEVPILVGIGYIIRGFIGAT